MAKKYVLAVSAFVDIISSYYLNGSLDNYTISWDGNVANPSGEVMKIAFPLISLCRETILPCIDRILLSFMLMSPYDGKQLLCTKTFTAYGNIYMLGNGMAIPYTDANKMAGSFIRKGNEVMSTSVDLTLLPNDLTFPSADVVFPRYY